MNPQPLNILLTGGGGLVGSALAELLAGEGHRLTRLSRRQLPGPHPTLPWRPEAPDGGLRRAALEPFDAIIHLAGENIAAGRWTAAHKRRVAESRVGPTGQLARLCAALERPPRAFLCASAVGYYGDRGAEVLDEASAPGRGFLAETCRAWEDALEPARAAGVRCANLRIGLVLARRGGALEKMLPPFRLGLGGPLGNGRQYMSWIHLDDLVGAIRHVLLREGLAGPINCVAPRAATNEEFSRCLARVLRRPCLFRAPALVLRAALGEMADALLLSGARVLPRRLLDSGFVFRHPELEPALRQLLGR